MDVLCIDVGGSSVKYGVINESLTIRDKGVWYPDGSSLSAYIESLGQLFDQHHDVEGLACAMPGIIDPVSGYFFSGGAYDDIIHELPFRDLLGERIPVRISVENDAKAAALAELAYGSLQDVADGIMITLGTAIGGALVYDHKVVYGKHYSAGELSFVNTTYEKPDFEHSFAGRCGSAALAQLVQEKTGMAETLSGHQIFALINEGNEEVVAALHDYCMELCVQLYNLMIVFDPEVIAIGGGISGQEALYEQIDICFEQMRANMRFFVRKPKVIPCTFGNDANMIGAYQRFMMDIEENE